MMAAGVLLEKLSAGGRAWIGHVTIWSAHPASRNRHLRPTFIGLVSNSEDSPMNIIVLLIILILLFGGGGFYFGGPYVGGGLGTILVIILIVMLLRGGL